MVDAFVELQNDRPLGVAGLGAIPFTAIDAWARRYGVRDFEAFRLGIRAMEAAQAKWEAAERGGRGSARSPDEAEAMRRAAEAKKANQ